MEAKSTGLSREMIIHPGETLAEVLSDRDLSQSELASRTGVSNAFVSGIINGKKRISSAFARKLEYATAVPAHFWSNLQAKYDDELARYEEQNNITVEEHDIIKRLKGISDHLYQSGILREVPTADDEIIQFRMWLGVSDLRNIQEITVDWAARKSVKVSTDPYILFAQPSLQ